MLMRLSIIIEIVRLIIINSRPNLLTLELASLAKNTVKQLVAFAWIVIFIFHGETKGSHKMELESRMFSF